MRLKKLRKVAASIGVTFVAFSSLLFSAPASADVTAGLTQDVYTYSSSALPDRVDTYTLCNSSIVPNVQFDVGGGVVADCQQDFVLIHWYGYITMPTSGDITFTSWADDGFFMSVGDQTVIDNWWLKGCGGGSGTHTFEAGVSQKIDMWWYEYGGGACNYLFTNNSDGSMTPVSDSAFTTQPAYPVVAPPVITPPVDPQPPVVNPPVDPQPPVVPPQDPQPPVVPPVVDPPVVPPVVVPPVVPPVVVPPSVPVVEPPKTPDTQKVAPPPVVVPPTVVPVEPSKPAVVPSVPPIASVDPATINPQALTATQVVQLQAAANETLATAAEDSPAYQQALDQLAVAAKADDIVVDPQLANTPVIGAVAVGVTNAINALGNIGADMSPAHRAKAKKEIVAAVVATGAAVNAVAGATSAAASSGSSSSSSRRKEK